MKVKDFLVQIYSKNNLFNHLSLFSLIGLFLLFTNNLLAAIGANLITFQLLAAPPSTVYELYFDLFFFLFISVYLYGYDFTFIQKNFFSENVVLPNFTMKSIYHAIKPLPLVLFIFVPYLLFIFSWLLILSSNTVLKIGFLCLAVFAIPFFHIVIINFAKTFKYNIENFNLVHVYRNVKKYFIKIIRLYIGIVAILIPLIIVFFGMIYLCNILSGIIKLSVYLLLACVGAYLLTVVKFYYFAALVKYIRG